MVILRGAETRWVLCRRFGLELKERLPPKKIRFTFFSLLYYGELIEQVTRELIEQVTRGKIDVSLQHTHSNLPEAYDGLKSQVSSTKGHGFVPYSTVVYRTVPFLICASRCRSFFFASFSLSICSTCSLFSLQKSSSFTYRLGGNVLFFYQQCAVS